MNVGGKWLAGLKWHPFCSSFLLMMSWRLWLTLIYTSEKVPCDLRVRTSVQICAPFSCAGSWHRVPPQTCLPFAGSKSFAVPKQTAKAGARLQQSVKVMIKLTVALFSLLAFPNTFNFARFPRGMLWFSIYLFFFPIPLPLMSLLQGRSRRRCGTPSPLLKWNPFVICWITCRTSIWIQMLCWLWRTAP